MNEQVLALAGAAAGVVVTILGILVSLRAARTARDHAVAVHFEAASDLQVDGEVIKAGDHRPGTHPRTVEVQREDGSRVALRVDPTDADSVVDFIDTAQRLRAERVLAVR